MKPLKKTDNPEDGIAYPILGEAQEPTDLSKVVEQLFDADPRYIAGKSDLTAKQATAVAVLQHLSKTYHLPILKEICVEIMVQRLSVNRKSRSEVVSIFQGRIPFGFAMSGDGTIRKKEIKDKAALIKSEL